MLPWPSQSPDLNPIENLLCVVDKKVKAAAPTNLDQLEKVLEMAWSSIPQEQCQKLINRCKKRCQAVVKSRGYPTKY